MEFQSEIRASTINELLEKVANKGYGKYLLKISIAKARAFKDKSIVFDFPVTAVVGPNGGGKTTVLGAAACAYRTVKPSLYFSKSGKFDENMQNWRFDYDLIDRSVKRDDTIRRSANFTNYKWSREGLDREVRIFGVSRTVPATERKEMRRCISGSFDVPQAQISKIGATTAKAIARILDKDVTDFSMVNVDGRGRVTLLAGTTNDGKGYSEFHFGAGESSVIRMAMILESVAENSLILIEEIENGLHPVATVRMVEYLIELAQRRKIQAIFTTHSNEALRPLPDKAIWAAVNGQLFQGKLDVGSLRAISGQIASKLVVFVEDTFSKLWVEAVFRSLSGVAMEALSVHSMEGDGNAVNVCAFHNINPTVPQPAICIIDGDSRQSENSDLGVFRLPGQSPEAYIFDQIIEKLQGIAGELTVALLRPYEEHSRVADVIRSVRNTNRDPHLLFSQVGKQLGFLPEDRVKEAFITLWVRAYPEEVNRIISQFRSKLPLDSV
ncbi:ATP-dependent nuclease [Acidicapsa acidisoli]|uniref:ATP-dependent nuclease n=1 Tax=Acidicapsa acidisoli TaxID=1615681 RepID=UPI0021E066B5|nr:AAA family ATPase [Acidicapsa acidisoli]